MKFTLVSFVILVCVASAQPVENGKIKKVKLINTKHNDNFFLVSNSPCDENPFAGVQSLCRASFPTYYYDKQANKCVSFTYGGCWATKNIFGSVEDCETQCVVL